MILTRRQVTIRTETGHVSQMKLHTFVKFLHARQCHDNVSVIVHLFYFKKMCSAGGQPGVCTGLYMLASGHCGGNSLDQLVDGDNTTVNGWIPESGEVTACQAKCTRDLSCSAVMVRDSDRACFWKTATSVNTRYNLTGTYARLSGYNILLAECTKP